MWALERLVGEQYWEVLTSHPSERDAEDKLRLLKSRQQWANSGQRITDYRITFYPKPPNNGTIVEYI